VYSIGPDNLLIKPLPVPLQNIYHNLNLPRFYIYINNNNDDGMKLQMGLIGVKIQIRRKEEEDFASLGGQVQII